MMKKYILTILLIVSTSIFAKTEKLPFEALCDDTDTITQKLFSKYGEKPIVIGIAGDIAGSTMSVWANSKTQSWSILATKDNITCIIGVGTKVTLVLGDTI